MVSLSSSLGDSLHSHAHKDLEVYLLYVQAYHWFKVRHYEGLASKLKSFGDKHLEWHSKILEYLTLRTVPVEVRINTLPPVNWTEEVAVYEYFLKIEEVYYDKVKSVFAQARGENDFDVENFLEEILEAQVQRIDEWEGEVLKIKGYTKTAGLIWLYDNQA
jgi:ferritin